MFLVIGLGNPGKQYENSRHNLGFRVLDLLGNFTINKQGFGGWQTKKGLNQFIKLEDVVLAKPETFMNKSGLAVKDLLKYYPDSELVVIHDDLDLPLGAMKIQKDASSAGHNGVRSIIDEIGTQDFIRIRLGIDNPQIRGQIPGDDFVLQKFTQAEENIVKEVLEKAKDAIDVLQTQGLEIAQSKYNG